MVQKALSRRRYFFGNRARILYELIGWQFRNAHDLRFMNYGFADDTQPGPDLHPEDEAERYCAQLYHALATQADLKGKNVLDIGSGRGGGAAFVHKYMQPRRTIGCDLARNAIRFCQRTYGDVANLKFTRANAMDLPFDDASFDAVLNVESSHCYPDCNAFFAEVFRVLKPGGCFLYTDFTAPGKAPAEYIRDITAALDCAGFVNVESSDITQQILRGLDADNDRRIREIHEHFPFGTRRLACLWAGTRGSWIYRDFASGDRRYVMYHLSKPEPAALRPIAPSKLVLPVEPARIDQVPA
jgi:SAM-dependent methyltransferase